MEKILNLSLYPTSRCDTGCSHCMDDCNMNNPQDFKPAMAKQIINEIASESSDLAVLLTGYGEPLMTPDLVETVETFGNYEKTRHVGIITSGFSDKDSFRKSQFEDLLNGSCAKKLSISQSFSLFHPSFPERLENIIKTIINNGQKKELTVRICLAVDNYKETWKATTKAIREISTKMGLEHRVSFFGWSEDDRDKYFFWVQKFIEDDRYSYHWAVEFESHLIPQWHFIVKKGATDWLLAIKIHPIVLEKIGRAKRISNRPVTDFSCGAFADYFGDDDFSALTIFPDGSVCSECCHKILYGKVGEDSLLEMDRRKSIFDKRLFKSILTDKRMFKWGTQDTCRLCQNLVAEKGLLLD
jgi:organic radical activating enzyme